MVLEVLWERSLMHCFYRKEYSFSEKWVWYFNNERKSPQPDQRHVKNHYQRLLLRHKESHVSVHCFILFLFLLSFFFSFPSSFSFPIFFCVIFSLPSSSFLSHLFFGSDTWNQPMMLIISVHLHSENFALCFSSLELSNESFAYGPSAVYAGCV